MEITENDVHLVLSTGELRVSQPQVLAEERFPLAVENSPMMELTRYD